MAPTAAVTSLSMPNNHNNRKNGSRSQVAASEDLYFGNSDGHAHDFPGEERRGQGEHEQGSLLGQALEVPGGRGEEVEDILSPASPVDYYDRLTPTSSSSRKSFSGNHTPLQHNRGVIKGPLPHSIIHNTTASQNGGHYDLSTASSFTNERRSNSDNSSSQQQQQDPTLYLSNRSLQSEDSVVMSKIANSVDTVPTSNVATLRQYQAQVAQKNNNGNTAHKRAQHQNNNPRVCVSPPPQLSFLHPSVVTKAQQRNSNAVASRNDHHQNYYDMNRKHDGASNSSSDNNSNSRRSVFGGRVQRRYPNPAAYTGGAPQDPAPFYNMIENEKHNQVTYRKASVQPPDWEILPAPAPPPPATSKEAPLPRVINTANDDNSIDSLSYSERHDTDTAADDHMMALHSKSGLTPPESPPRHAQQPLNPSLDAVQSSDDLVSPLQSPPLDGGLGFKPSISSSSNNNKHTGKRGKRRQSSYYSDENHNNSNKFTETKNLSSALKVHETIHAQSLLLGLCFMAIWSPNNIMAPNLTQVAQYYGMTENERDLYLGSFLALATGVLSFPLSALIGIMTDMYSRKRLFVATAMGGAISAAATGSSPTYPCLLLARFFSGGFMSASVSVAFSLLGDLFATEERNAASSGLTAMMGVGIVLGQVYAGEIGTSLGWQHAFFVSSGVTFFFGLCVALLVQEPVRGGKEKVLQDMLRQGKQYDRKLTWSGFWHAMTQNQSNFILMAQGFFSSMPWGIVFVFLNDYLSQERGFSVPDATYIVLIFGIGCAIGGIAGGYMGARIMMINRALLPVFMSVTTVLGILPFMGLLNGHTTNAHGYWAMMLSVMAGVVASLPAVNVRPCLINVNPPETRGASLTAANLIVNLARGIGPCCITLLGSTFGFSRQASFNITIVGFWVISGIQLCYLANTLPQDQDKMEAELARYAASAMAMTTPAPGASTGIGRGEGDTDLLIEYGDTVAGGRPESSKSLDDETLVSIEDRMTTFDGTAARESLSFFQKGMSEISFGRGNFCAIPGPHQSPSDESGSDYYYDEDDECATPRNSSSNLVAYNQQWDDDLSPLDLIKRREQWIRQQRKLYGTQGALEDHEDNIAGWNDGTGEEKQHPSETTRLV